MKKLLPTDSSVLIYFINYPSRQGWGWPHISATTRYGIFLERWEVATTFREKNFQGDKIAQKFANAHNIDSFVDDVYCGEWVRMFFSSGDLL